MKYMDMAYTSGPNPIKFFIKAIGKIIK